MCRTSSISANELSQNNLCFYTVLLNAFRAACSLHTCRYAPDKQLENQIRIFSENSIVYFVPATDKVLGFILAPGSRLFPLDIGYFVLVIGYSPQAVHSDSRLPAPGCSPWILDILPSCGIPQGGTGYWIFSPSVNFISCPLYYPHS